MATKTGLRAVIMAAGQGTRMRSTLPKVMHPVLGVPMIGCVLEAAREAGVDGCVVVVGHGREQVEGYASAAFGEAMGLAFAHQAEQLGTAHAVQQALPALEGFEGQALILSGDVPNVSGGLLGRLIEEGAGRAVSFVTMRVEDPTGYGRVVRDEGGRARAIVEDRDCDAAQRAIREVNAGLYLVDAGFLRRHLGAIDARNEQAEFYLTDLVARAAEGEGAWALVAPDAREVAGVNDRGQLAAAEAFASQRVNARWLAEGVGMTAPETAWIERSVELGSDVRLGAGVALRGATRIGRGARLERGCVLTDAVIGAGARLGPGCVLEGVEVGAEARLGAYVVGGRGVRVEAKARVAPLSALDVAAR